MRRRRVAIVLDNSLSTRPSSTAAPVLDRLNAMPRATRSSRRARRRTGSGSSPPTARARRLARRADRESSNRVEPFAGRGRSRRSRSRARRRAAQRKLAARSSIAVAHRWTAHDVDGGVDAATCRSRCSFPSGAPPSESRGACRAIARAGALDAARLAGRARRRRATRSPIASCSAGARSRAAPRDAGEPSRRSAPPAGARLGGRQRRARARRASPATTSGTSPLWIGPPPGVAVGSPRRAASPRRRVDALIADGRAAPGRCHSRRVRGRCIGAAGAHHRARRSGAARCREPRARALGHSVAIRRAATRIRRSRGGGRLDGVTVTARYDARAQPGVAPSDTLATAGGEPWVVAGPGYVLVASPPRSRRDQAARARRRSFRGSPTCSPCVSPRPPETAARRSRRRQGARFVSPLARRRSRARGGSRRSITAESMKAPERARRLVLPSRRTPRRRGRRERTGRGVRARPVDRSDALAARLGGVTARSSAASAGVGRRHVSRPASRARSATPLLIARSSSARRRSALAVRTSRRRSRVSVAPASARRDRAPAGVRPRASTHCPRRGARAARRRALPGSADAALVAALARRLPTRFFVVVADGVCRTPSAGSPISRRCSTTTPVALYPPREGFGEAEPHVEIAGERVETLERLSARRGPHSAHDARARCSSARGCRARSRDLRIELRKGDVRRPRELAAHLERIGFERVPMVEDVAQFSRPRRHLRRVLASAWPIPCASSSGATRSSTCATSISRRSDPRARSISRVVLPGGRSASARTRRAVERRLDLVALSAGHARSCYPTGAHIEPELQRTWDEAAAPHRSRAPSRRGRRRARRAVRVARRGAAAALAAFGALGSSIPPRSDRRRRLPASRARDRSIATSSGCGASCATGCRRSSCATTRDRPSARRAAERGRRASHPARRSSIGVLDGGFVMPPLGRRARACACSPTTRSSGASAASVARVATSAATRSRRSPLKPGDYVVHLEHGVGIYRGIETIFVGQSTIEVAVVEYEGGDRLNVPLYRIDQLERYRSADDVSDDAPPPRLHRLGGKRWAQQRDRTRAAIQEMTVELLDLYARRKVALAAAARPGHAVADAARVVVPLRGHARPAQGDDRREGGHGEHAADGPPARRRRRLRQDGDRRARRVQGGAVGAAGRRARADDDSRRPARAHLRASGSPTFPIRIAALSRFQNGEGAGAVARRARDEQDRHRHRHASAAQPGRRRSATSG